MIEKNCPFRVWFGDYALHYCDVDKEICDNEKCRHATLVESGIVQNDSKNKE